MIRCLFALFLMYGPVFGSIISKLNSHISSLDNIKRELRTLNSEYTTMESSKRRGTEINTDVEVEVEPLIDERNFLERRNQDSGNHCYTAESEFEKEVRDDEARSIRTVFCPVTNSFLNAVQHGDNGVIVGVCCERKKTKKPKRSK